MSLINPLVVVDNDESILMKTVSFHTQLPLQGTTD